MQYTRVGTILRLLHLKELRWTKYKFLYFQIRWNCTWKWVTENLFCFHFLLNTYCKFDVYSCKLPIRYLFTIISWAQNTNKCKHRNRILFCHSIHSTSRSLKQVQFSIPMHIAKFSIHMTPEHVFAASYRALQISCTPSEILIKVKKKWKSYLASSKMIAIRLRLWFITASYIHNTT